MRPVTGFETPGEILGRLAAEHLARQTKTTPGTWPRVSLDRVGLVVFAVLGCIVGALYVGVPVDLPWNADLGHLYSVTWGVDVASKYVYPPTVAQVIAVLHLIGQPAAVFIWTVALWLAAWVAYRQWSLPVLVLALPALFVPWPLVAPILLLLLGNVQIAIAAVCVLGFRYPALWAFGILTKIAPGIGVLWFLFRGEWRSLAIALGVTAAIAGISIVVSPGAWGDYLAFAQRNAGTPSPVPVVPVPFALRVAMSVALLAWGAPRNHRWTVPIAVGWSAIALYEWSYLAIWAAALSSSRWPGGSLTGLSRRGRSARASD